MIEINLVPGSAKKTRRRATGVNFTAVLADAAARVKDPILIGSVVTVILSVVLVGWLWMGQRNRIADLQAQLDLALADSTNNSGLIADLRAVQGQRDSVLRQIRLIRIVDDQRFVWGHIFDEISRRLPDATWLTIVEFTSPAVSPAQLRTDSAGVVIPPDTLTPPAPLKLRIRGQVVDFQALPKFAADLEASPFFENVMLSNVIPVQSAEIPSLSDFIVDADYEIPPPSAIRRVPMQLTGR